MRKFIGYFDYLGFKDFILNNDLEYQRMIIDNIFRDIESSLGKGKQKEAEHRIIADMAESRINCTNFSDTVIFWSNDDSIESLKEIIEVTYSFNQEAINYLFPVRGTILYGEIVHVDFRQANEGGGVYNINSIFGKGMVEAHLKTEQQNWAGTVIDQSIIKFLNENDNNPSDFLFKYAKRYKIPYKPGIEITDEEFAFCLVKNKLNKTAYENFKSGIEENFSNHNKKISSPNAKIKLENTLLYLKSFRDDE